MLNATYKQPVKERVRTEILTYAIDTLTSNREEAACVKKNYVRDVFNHLKNQDYSPANRKATNDLELEYIDLWEKFHQSNIGKKNAEELTVCYLCGPEPMNDFNVLIEKGINPHNIWAFENENMAYSAAVEELRQNKFPFPKIHKGSIENFFIDIPKKFDIIYLDGCAPISSKNNHTLRIIVTLLRNHRLNSVGALITNFALPDIKDESIMYSYSYLIASYLYPKTYLASVSTEMIYNNKVEFDITEFDKFIKIIESKFSFYYSQFITRVIMDMSTVIVPSIRFANSRNWTNFFCGNANKIASEYIKKNDNELLDTLLCSPVLWTECFINEALQGKISNINKSKYSKKIISLLQNWSNEINGDPQPHVRAYEAILSKYVLRESSGYYKESFKNIINDYNYENRMFQFCDVPNKTLAYDVITNQLSYPMHYTTEAIKRWDYKAKETQMFIDAIIFDECRYIYEWLPTIDLLEYAFKDKSWQLSYRFALDGLIKSRLFYNTEFFFGGSVIQTNEVGFEAKKMKARIYIDKLLKEV